MLEKELSKEKAKSSKQITGAEALILSLLEEGVDTVFGYPGGAIMPIYDALYDYQDKINHILVRHEQGAVHAAQGYARVSDKAGVCFATSGPGATNLVTGIADAQIDSTPLVCITGQVASHLLGTDAFQETDVIGISMPITKWNLQVTKPEDIPAAVARAFYIARSGRPGPVLLDITKDAQFGKLHYKYEKCEKIRSYRPYPKLNMGDVDKAVELINKAKKPFILAGHGVLISGAENELRQFAEKTGIPVAVTLLGLSAIPTDHQLYVGFLGMHGNYGPNIKTNECDLLIAVGMRFDDRVTGDISKYAKQAKVIHIEIDPSEINKIVKADVAVNSDAKEALKALSERVSKASHEKWMQEFRDCKKLEYEKVEQHDLYPGGKGLKMAEVVRLISEKASADAIIVTDVGQHQMVTSRYYNYRKPNTNITSGGLGTMGFALPAAIGAKVGKPGSDVIAIIGDGGFQMTLQELGTINQSKMPVKIVILNNNFLGMVRQWQQLFYEKRYSSVEMINPDFVMIAKGFNIESAKVTERSDIEAAIGKMLDHKGSYLLEVVVEKEENVFPMVPTGASVAEIRLE
ncbi:MAG: biosynthetic-type acetolactate synthase large subunit [Bacteroidetes bacterium]|nr:biosynthetic-type acetolactate synthase large subunit [Bacteroidota bacterium]